MTPILMTLELLRAALSYQTIFHSFEDHPNCRLAVQAKGEMLEHLNNGFIILTDPAMQTQNGGQAIVDLTPEDRTYIQTRIIQLDTYIESNCR